MNRQAGNILVLHSLDAKNEGYYHVDVQIRDTDVLMLMLVHHQFINYLFYFAMYSTIYKMSDNIFGVCFKCYLHNYGIQV